MNLIKCFLVTLLSPSVFAGPLDGYITKAVENSHLMQRNSFQSQKLSIKKESSTLWKNPTIGLEYGRVKNTGINGSLLGATLEQSIPINGRLGLEADKVNEEIKQAKISGNWQLNEFKAEVVQNFLLLWLEREKISHAKHRVKDLAILRKYLTNRKFSSPQQKSDAYLIKKKIDEIEYQLQENSYREMKLKKALGSLTGEEIGNFQLKLRSKDKIIPFFDSFIKEARSIEEYRKSQLRKSELSLKQQDRKWIPNIGLGYAYQKENVPGGNLSHAIGLNFSIPIFDTGRSGADEVRADIRVQKAKWELQDLRRGSKVESLKERLRYHINLAGGPLEKKEIQHEKELRKIKNYFLKGLINAQTYLDTEEISHELHYRQVNALTQVINVFVDASLLTGKEFELKEVIL